MDLGIIHRRLKRGTYAQCYQVWMDLRQIWTNCFMYHEPAAPVAMMCRKLQAKVEGLWDSMGIPHTGKWQRGRNRPRISVAMFA